jgi:ATP-dependent Clp protease ATP-binding subunit ClpC
VEIEVDIESEDWQSRKSGLFAKIDKSDFWSSPGRFAVLGLLEAVDRIEQGADRARRLMGRIETHAGRDNLPGRLLALLAQNIYLLATARDDVKAGRPREAYLLVEALADGLHDTPEVLGFGRKIANMYEAWAKNRNMRLARLFRSNPHVELEMRALYAISGYGAYSILEGETGLHVRERPGETQRDHRRDTVRITVVAQPDEPPSSSTAEAAALAWKSIENSGRQSSEVVRRYREAPSPLVRDLARGWRTGRLDLVLGGDFDLFR